MDDDPEAFFAERAAERALCQVCRPRKPCPEHPTLPLRQSPLARVGREAMIEAQRKLMREALARHDWVQARAARELQITAQEIGNWIDRLGMVDEVAAAIEARGRANRRTRRTQAGNE